MSVRRALLIAVAVVFVCGVAWVAIALPRETSVRVLSLLANSALIVGLLGLTTVMVLSRLEQSERVAEGRKKSIERTTGIAGRLTAAGFAVSLSSQGPLLIIEGSWMWGLILLGGFAVIVLIMVFAHPLDI